MKISKKDALMWFEFFASLPEDEELLTSHYEIIYSVFAPVSYTHLDVYKRQN